MPGQCYTHVETSQLICNRVQSVDSFLYEWDVSLTRVKNARDVHRATSLYILSKFQVFDIVLVFLLLTLSMFHTFF